jgi:GT2 family glycosyltransferase
MIEVAALLTCYNRKHKTLDCITHLYNANIPNLSVFLVDDGSRDGTSDAVKNKFPEVTILHGDGNLYWNGGMHRAFEAAIQKGFDYYLWVNDDTLLFNHAWDLLKKSISRAKEESSNPFLIVGSTCDPDSGKLTYGGLVRNSRIKKLRFDLVEPAQDIKSCETMNGNCVLIHKGVVERIGNLDSYFTHAMGDFDYGLRAKAEGCAIWVAPEFIGSCSKNSPSGTWRDTSLKTKDRLKALKSTKGLPNKEWKEFARRYAGPAWPIYWLSPLMRIYLEQLKSRLTGS